MFLTLIEGLDIPQDGIVLPTDHLGRSSGEAYVKFASKDQADTALGKNKERIGHRWDKNVISCFSSKESSRDAHFVDTGNRKRLSYLIL